MINELEQEIVLKLESHQLWVKTNGEKGERLVIDEVDLQQVKLQPYRLDQASITDCLFNYMDLQEKDFHSTLLSSSAFVSANLVNADFYRADISYANFSNASMENVRLAKADCSETEFQDSNLKGANLAACLFYLTDLRNSDLSEADISSASFEETLLNGASLTALRGIEEALITSINIGTPENPILLEGMEARNWIINKSKTN